MSMDRQDIIEMRQDAAGESTTARRRSLLIAFLVYWLVVAFFAVTVWRQLSEVNFNLV
jgi:hypothetical protein